MKMRATLVSLAAGLLVIGCSGDGPTDPPEPQPQPGALRVTLSSGTAVGGVVFTVTGAGITSPAAVGGATMYHDLSGGTLTTVVTGSSLSGAIVTFTVPDVRQVAAYTVTVQQAAGTSNQVFTPGGVTLSVVE